MGTDKEGMSSMMGGVIDGLSEEREGQGVVALEKYSH